MSGAFNLSDVHHLERVRDPDGSVSERLTRITPHMGVSQGANPPYWICAGGVYDEAGTQYALKDLPEWFWEEFDKISDKILQIHGFETRPENPFKVKKDLTTKVRKKRAKKKASHKGGSDIQKPADEEQNITSEEEENITSEEEQGNEQE